jgi:hypothetical protein
MTVVSPSGGAYKSSSFPIAHILVDKAQHHMELFSRSFGEGLEARLTGPGKGRFVLQPLVAIALGIRDGIVDAKQGKPPYFIRVLFKSERKFYVLKTSLKSIATPLTIGIVLDMILQWLIFRAVFLVPALIAGTILVAIPYSVARGLSNRVARRWCGPREELEVTSRSAPEG